MEASCSADRQGLPNGRAALKGNCFVDQCTCALVIYGRSRIYSPEILPAVFQCDLKDSLMQQPR